MSGEMRAIAGVCAWLVVVAPLLAQAPKPRATLQGHGETVVSVAFSPDGKTLASATRRSRKLLDLNHQFAGPLLAFSPDGQTLASGGQCIREVRLWDVAAGRVAATLTGLGIEPQWDAYGVTGLAFSPDGKTLATVASHGGLKLWDVATGRHTATYQRAGGSHCSVVFSPDGKLVAASSGEKTVQLWNAATGRVQLTLTGHAHQVRSVAFSPDGRTLASAGGADDEPGELKLWEVLTGQERANFPGHSAEVRAVAFSPDGKTLASAGGDKSVRLWDLSAGR
jgi:WD40 repeat protein